MEIQTSFFNYADQINEYLTSGGYKFKKWYQNGMNVFSIEGSKKDYRNINQWVKRHTCINRTENKKLYRHFTTISTELFKAIKKRYGSKNIQWFYSQNDNDMTIYDMQILLSDRQVENFITWINSKPLLSQE